MKFKKTIAEACIAYNLNNPEKKPINVSSISKDIGTDSQYIYQLGKRFSKQFQSYFDLVFINNDKNSIIANWNNLVSLDIIMINRIEAIRVILGCEIYDLICVEN